LQASAERKSCNAQVTDVTLAMQYPTQFQARATPRGSEQLKRREFIALLGGTTLIWPLAASCSAAAESGQRRIGYLSNFSGPTEYAKSFVQGLRELGYVEGKNVTVEYRFAMGKSERLAELAADLVRDKVDLIVTEGTPSTLAAMHATTTIPIVFGSMQDPIEKGVVASLAHPGGNVTGNALIADHSKSLELLKRTVPGVSEVVFIYDPATRPGAYGQAKLRELQNDARTLGMVVNAIGLSDAEGTDRVFAALPTSTDAILLENSVINLLARDRLCTLATRRRLPSVGPLAEFAEAGCLISYGENLADNRRAAGYVDKIFKDSNPADLPIQQAVTFRLTINLRTAKQPNLTVPELVLVGADKIIE
jgi:putative tryptophan/tyrosine transport system substrate-binding protein